MIDGAHQCISGLCCQGPLCSACRSVQPCVVLFDKYILVHATAHEQTLKSGHNAAGVCIICWTFLQVGWQLLLEYQTAMPA